MGLVLCCCGACCESWAGDDCRMHSRSEGRGRGTGGNSCDNHLGVGVVGALEYVRYRGPPCGEVAGYLVGVGVRVSRLNADSDFGEVCFDRVLARTPGFTLSLSRLSYQSMSHEFSPFQTRRSY